MQRRRKSTTSVSTHSSSRASRAARLEAVRRASLATYERLENRQMLSTVNPTPVGPGDGWTSAYYNNKGGGSQNAGSADPLNDWLLGNGGMTPTPVFSKITPTINVAGSNPLGPPGVPGFNGGNNYSIRYDGYLLVPNSGTMTFSVGTDDGVQVSIDETTAAAENAATPTAPNWVTVDQQMQIGRGIGNPYNESFVVGSTTLPVNDGTKNAIDNNTNSGAAFSFTAGQLYHVVFTYQNGGGGWGSNFGWSGPASGQANPTIIPKANVYSVLPAVQNVNATAGNGANQVTWTSNVVSDATGGGSIVGPADSFLIERQANFGAFSTLATVTADYSGNNVASFAYNDYTAVDGTTYNYRVTPINGYGTGDSNSSGSVIANDGPIPAPTHVTASRTGTSSVALTWDPGTSASGGYIVSRYATNDGNGNPTGTPVTFNVPVFTAINVPTLATFTDTTAPALAVGQGYFYTVTSVAGAEAPGNVVSNSVASPAVFVGSGDGWDASYYGFRDGQDHHTADDPNALLGFQRVETGPVAIGGPFGANGDNTAPPNSPAQWFATGANQVLANPGSGAGDNFDGRWVGYVQAPVTGYYTFNLGSDDGNNVVYWDAAHLDVNGNPTGVALNNNQIFASRGIPSPFDVAPVVDTTGAPVLFTAGHKYLIQYEFNNGGGGWGANLMWSAGATSGGTDLMNPEYVPAGDVMAPTPVFKTVYANDVKLTGNTVNDGSILTGTTVTMGSVTKDNAATGFYALHLTTND
ncbi:MAG: glycoside hydrolase family protein, partial [Phycisphaerales bacterium]|nr:glycoside hydrolase family protein [Phycisphaerales bacterium]